MSAAASGLTVLGIGGLGEIRPGDELGTLIAGASDLRDRDVVVVTQKIVSKAEGRLVAVAHDDTESRRRLVESESVRVLRRRGELIIAETPHGFVCANAGVDFSNVPEGHAALLPRDPDRSARRVRDAIRGACGRHVGVVVSDTFGRPWRRGLTDVAIGCAGVLAILDLRGTSDAGGRRLQVTEVAIVDELAAAAELVMGKDSGIPAAIVRGAPEAWFGDGRVGRDLVRPAADDLFR
ncbi:MAG: coenzyme F420-0:L-glutamate ligase [Acidimicrobiia bacterium]|nr:coenzyme F420-0:L-glutamate ligase [Acidimicrobiia bacterium]